ncbi:AraD1 family protein [Paludibacterium sp.]|uniref:AraD1 family protein n=1 Tax=Paludibacterium sp. TaxID=1917523 RepID=UPI0025F5B4CC|nr:AraD1 family protein [Paludibacterium sp.]MBV8647303.1 FAH family protein [Paludibacterium sp.]
MLLIQYLDPQQRSCVGLLAEDGESCRPILGVASSYDLAWAAIAAGHDLATQVASRHQGEPVSYAALERAGALLPPLTHADVAHCHVTGTGLTHLGSAATRDQMHQAQAQAEAGGKAVTDSMKMFQWGMAGGRHRPGQPGTQPEWFYKGDGSIVTAPGQALPSPDFALDHGEEPELVGLYLIGPDHRPYRLGFAVGNEFSDHVTERKNYLYLAHSKLRPCAMGPALRVGALPADLTGESRIERRGEVLWQRPFLTGEANMCHSIANLEYHHFKYAQFLQPGDVHLHFFGTATLSFADGVCVEAGDTFVLSLPGFGPALRNPVASRPSSFAIEGVVSL